MSSEQKTITLETPTVTLATTTVCGGIGNSQAVDEEDLNIWNMYKAHLESKIQDQFKIPADYTLKPIQVSKQVVAGINYFFKVELPDKKYATARVYHVLWLKDTHGKADHVAVHPKLADNINEDVGHF
ncbi:unnamed protein product [Rotaria magnacalcarata]|uniref:Cystatin domain-containing protein n=2 Tax=Rotaria magnacalcarata TaxID=392030 RepID=A0A816ZAK3_9BILA|nr:unnamed protein product [Rotaria magnacalcarata]CAF1423846.1 unnamed protein product [Rotaria magnacalcarata]CAF2102372.1 unnamed protein product [Rotaria magnacalcarata]CAF2200513.1 unnamed protein product [Rotaria magnacalcarata]CAF2201225.1 unnamed protein product [Rotaria magnacalcarata]